MRNITITIGRYFPYLVGVVSTLNIIALAVTGTFNSLSLMVSAVGITACLLSLYESTKGYTKTLFYIWIGAQVLVIYSNGPVFDCTQVLSVAGGFFSSSRANTTSIKVNWIAILYFTLYRLYQLSGLVGSRITLYKLRRTETVLDDLMPTEATIVKQVQLGKDGEWLLIETEKTLDYDGLTINQFLIQRKDKELIKPGSGNQVLFLRVVESPAMLDGSAADNIDNFPPLDWAVCK